MFCLIFEQVEAGHGVLLLNCVKERLGSSSLSRDSDMTLNLEFTLGRPSWQKEHAESPTELTLLKC